MIEFWQPTLEKYNKRADSNAIIGHRKFGKSKKLLRFIQAYLHKVRVSQQDVTRYLWSFGINDTGEF